MLFESALRAVGQRDSYIKWITLIMLGEKMIDKLLTARDVARLLNISLSNAYNLVKRGEMVSIRIGKSVRVTESDYIDYVNTHRSFKDCLQKNTKLTVQSGEFGKTDDCLLLMKGDHHE